MMTTFNRIGRSDLDYALADSGGLSPCGLGCALADLGCALVAWAVPLQFGAAPF